MIVLFMVVSFVIDVSIGFCQSFLSGCVVFFFFPFLTAVSGVVVMDF